MQAEELMHLMQVVMVPKAASLIQSCDRADRNGTTNVFHVLQCQLESPYDALGGRDAANWHTLLRLMLVS
jgi:hypothetical protein